MDRRNWLVVHGEQVVDGAVSGSEPDVELTKLFVHLTVDAALEVVGEGFEYTADNVFGLDGLS